MQCTEENACINGKCKKTQGCGFDDSLYYYDFNLVVGPKSALKGELEPFTLNDRKHRALTLYHTSITDQHSMS